ncbi:MAG: FAD-dependent monooxygenase [Burkholderiales bacterium]
MSAATDYDVMIAGGGPVGFALARLLADTPLRVRLVAPLGGRGAAPVARAAFRPLALAYPSKQLLERLDLIQASDGTPIRTIHVSQRGGFGRTVIRADDHGLPGLGYVVDATELASRILKHAASWTNPAHTPGQVTAWSRDGDHTLVDLADAEGVMHQRRTHLLVVADGGASSGTTVRDYDQIGIVATIKTERAHENTAYERFTSEGPLALLPYEDRYAVVWSVKTAAATAITGADDAAFCAALGGAFGNRLGRFTHAGSRAAYPLVLRRWADSVTAGIIAIGNAAQTLHPVAGQGLNLGLRDAEVLAARICASGAEALATDTFVRGYLAARAPDRIATIAATDFLARAFTWSAGPATWLRGAGLAALDVFPPARALLARRMMLGSRGIP